MEKLTIIQGVPPKENQPLLPRSPWQSQICHLYLVFKAKKALDLAEQKSQSIQKT